MFDHVFVLCTGRCGSRTWARACSHITNWSSGHETRNRIIAGRLDYPARHIEVDNRLSWFLGGLDRAYTGRALWVHLTRDPADVVASLVAGRDSPNSIIPAFGKRIVRTKGTATPPRPAVARLYVQTATENIDLFLRSQPSDAVMRTTIEDPHDVFVAMCDAIGAEGDLAAAHAELDRRHGERKVRR